MTTTMTTATIDSLIPAFLNDSGVDFEIGGDRVTFSGDVLLTELVFDGADFIVVFDGITMIATPDIDRARHTLWGFLADACNVPF